jgi:two-component system NtrC family sensor kinase
MTIRGKVLLLLTVASGLVLMLGLVLQQGAAQGRLIRDWASGVHEQLYILSQIRGDALVFLADLQRAHASGASSEAVLDQQRRRIEAHLARLYELEQSEVRWSGVPRGAEVRHIERMEQALRLWAEHAETRVRQLPSGIGSDGAHPRETINEFGRSVEPLLVAALEAEHNEVKELEELIDDGLETGEAISLAVPLASLGVLLTLALAILLPMNRRFEELLVGVERIGRGELSDTLPEHGRDELGSLARRFNQMARELKDSQTRLIAADRMALLGRTTASVGHEINNPLAYVLTNLSFLREELEQVGEGALPGKRKQELLEALSEAREGADRVRFIVQDLKALSRTQNDVGLAPVELGAVVRGVSKMAQHSLRGRARLVERCGEVPPVRGNATRLGQVFLNLIINAAHAIAPGNEDTNEIRVLARVSAPGFVTVDVQDTGSGIPPEHLERIFDPFFTTKPEGEGTGLGLLVCQTIVTSLGGTITVESTPGQGTTFHITLPIAVEAAASAAPA